MKTILCVGASARSYSPHGGQHQSISKQLGEVFITKYKAEHNETEVIYRELSVNPPPFITEEFIAACFNESNLNEQQAEALAYSDQLINEVISADIILITSPMYNYGMPAILKAWFDQIIRIGKTFSFDLTRGDKPLRPILSGKKLVLCASWGEFAFKKGESEYHLNHLSSHIEQLSPYLGADKFYEIASEYQEFGDERHLASKMAAVEGVSTLAKHLALES